MFDFADITACKTAAVTDLRMIRQNVNFLGRMLNHQLVDIDFIGDFRCHTRFHADSGAADKCLLCKNILKVPDRKISYHRFFRIPEFSSCEYNADTVCFLVIDCFSIVRNYGYIPALHIRNQFQRILACINKDRISIFHKSRRVPCNQISAHGDRIFFFCHFFHDLCAPVETLDQVFFFQKS